MQPIRLSRLVTARLLLKPLEPSDAPALFAYRADPAVCRYQRWRPVREEEATAFIERHGRHELVEIDNWCQLGVHLRPGGELIGDVGLHLLPPDGSEVELGFTICPAHQRRGYATEAVGALLARLFADAGIRRVTASVDPRNTASIGLLEKMGMRRVAHHVRSVRTPEGWADDLVYALRREDGPLSTRGMPAVY